MSRCVVSEARRGALFGSTGILACPEERRVYPENRRACAASRYVLCVAETRKRWLR